MRLARSPPHPRIGALSWRETWPPLKAVRAGVLGPSLRRFGVGCRIPARTELLGFSGVPRILPDVGAPTKGLQRTDSCRRAKRDCTATRAPTAKARDKASKASIQGPGGQPPPRLPRRSREQQAGVDSPALKGRGGFSTSFGLRSTEHGEQSTKLGLVQPEAGRVRPESGSVRAKGGIRPAVCRMTRPGSTESRLGSIKSRLKLAWPGLCPA